MFQETLLAVNVNGLLERQWSRKSCDRVETARQFTYLGDKVSANLGCEAAVTARIRCGWAKSNIYGEP